MTASRLLLGKIATAHGVRGLVKILVLGEDPQRLETCGPAYSAAQGGKELRLTMKNPLGKYYLAEVEGIADRNAAELLRHTELWIDRDKLPEAEDGEYYYADLTGMDVIENGAVIGKVIAVENFGASDLLEIQPTAGEAFYFPFTDDNVLSVEETAITVSIPEGLRE